MIILVARMDKKEENSTPLKPRINGERVPLTKQELRELALFLYERYEKRHKVDAKFAFISEFEPDINRDGDEFNEHSDELG